MQTLTFLFAFIAVLALIGVAGIIELVGSLMVLAGFQTRLAAFILSGELAFAYFIGHAPKGNVLSPMLNGGESAVLFCFIFLYIAAAGGGAWALDRRSAA